MEELTRKEQRELGELRARTEAHERKRQETALLEAQMTAALRMKVLTIEWAQCLGFEPIGPDGAVESTIPGMHCLRCGVHERLGEPEVFGLAGQEFKGRFPDCPHRVTRIHARMHEEKMQERVDFMRGV